ncbi:MAG: sugar kinase [Flavobacteriales bacterium]|jgi:sugar/nucleoside kinase (ribokinase family)|nr:sugar kinase [Flavobacteriales bacterium]MBT6650379.1 sugar kinase [Flavobacteriales bacterium]
MSILVVGTVAFDAIETPFGKTDKIVGGAATYICLSSSFFTKKLNLVSVVGEDFPKETIQMLKEKNVNTKGLQIKEGEKTFFWSGKYHNNMNTRDTMDTQLNVLENFEPIVPEEFKDSEFLMLGNLMPSVQKKVLDQMTKRPKLIVLDTMNFWMDLFMDDLKEALKEVDVLTINDEEARQLSGEYSLVKAAKVILAMGPKYLIIKKGEHGALLFNNKEVFFAPALPLEEVFDPTGAGDSFAGGFIGYLAKTNDVSFENMKRAVINGSAMASFCVEKFGTQKLTEINQDDVDARINEFVNLVKFDISLK